MLYTRERRVKFLKKNMGKSIIQWVPVLIFILLISTGILISGGEVYANGGFEVPKINDHFDEVNPGPQLQTPESVTQPAKEESGIWDQVTEPISKGFNWIGEKVSGAWEKTKEFCAEAWNELVEFFHKMAEVIVDSLSAVWDWIVKYKEYIAFTGVVILGIVLCFVAPPLGAAVLSGVALSFIISVALNDGKIDKTTFLEGAIGGLLGLCGMGIAGGLTRGLATGLGQKLITGLANSKVLGPILLKGSKLISKLPSPLQKIFTKAGLVGGVEGAGTSIVDDKLHGRSINWKMAIFSGLIGAATVGVVAFAQPVIDKTTAAFKPIIEKIPIVKNLDDCFAYQHQPTLNFVFANADLPVGKVIKCLTNGNGKVKTNENITYSADKHLLDRKQQLEQELKDVDEMEDLTEAQKKELKEPVEAELKKVNDELDKIASEKMKEKALAKTKKEANDANWVSLQHKGNTKDGRKAKHVPKSNWDEDDLLDYSSGGKPALYHPKLSDPSNNYRRLEEFERKAWETGIEVDASGKGVRYKIVKYDKPIGASEGKKSYWLRIELTGSEASPSIHGHPITEAQFNDYWKKRIDKGLTDVPSVNPGF